MQKLLSGDCVTPAGISMQWDFAYDGDGTRVKQIVSTYDQTTQSITGIAITAYFMGGAYEVTTDANNVALSTKKYYSIAGMTVAMNDGSGLQYLLTDHLGSVVAVTDSNGTLTSQQRYLPFGQVRTDLNGPRVTQTDFLYTGQRANSYIKLDDYKSRWYSDQLGRFISPDSIVPDPSNPQNLNRYSYAGNSPIVYNDPSGHCFDPLAFVLCVAAGIAIGVGWDIMTTSKVIEPQPAPPSRNQTQWLVDKLNQNANAPVTQALSDNWNSRNPMQMAGALKSWVSIVGGNAIWDYKVAERNGGYDKLGYVRLAGQNVNWAAPANINYGYMAAKMGMPEDFAEYGAGLAQLSDNCKFQTGFYCGGSGWFSSHLDNPTDNYWVKYGYFLAQDTTSKSGHLTTSDITSSLNDWETMQSVLQNNHGLIHRE